MITTECGYKVLLCIYLMFRGVRQYLTLKVVMLPYAVGYMLHFILGHFVPIEDNERAEGCNVVSSLFSDLGRFLCFVLVVSISMKVDNASSVMYDWEAAFWPCWGLEGVIALVVLLVLPACVLSTMVDRRKLMMLTWVVLAGLGLGAVSFVSMYNIAFILDNKTCSTPPYTPSTASGPTECSQRLQLSIWPWLIFLPSFGIVTTLAKRPLSLALHDAWYQPGRGPEVYPPSIVQRDLPAPRVLFRVTATYYSRHWEAALEAETPPATGSAVASIARISLDPSASILSARGANYEEIVESEQLCFICYDQVPQAVLLECGHAGMCVSCALQLLERRASQATCAICRNPISNVVRLRADMSLPSSLFARPRQSGASSRSQSAALLEAGNLGAGSSEREVWPAAAKRAAVVVEVVHRQTAGRWWIPSLLR
ncbi:unnamed protein product [Symbiodinium natans]|uniref:RING-type domain-containing protein n=1 Tax=Symbiodinium natans TaxID=878477 RepID=A0A812RMB9_9DINO|nr:unnamed protein product [Symbiodinium natans]